MTRDDHVKIERGGPPKMYGELLGGYLKALPDGIEPQDLVNPAAGATGTP